MPEDRRHTSSVRKLAAIMFTDIVGYTTLMGKNEDRAFEILAINRDIHNTILSRHNGTLIKEMGDGILASFHSASDAVRCAGEIQKSTEKAGIPLRVGIHQGEVVFEGGDVLGDGVNVAFRLEELADEGCIYVSGTVYNDIKNKEGIHANFVKKKTLKNVDEPVKIYNVNYDQTLSVSLSQGIPESEETDKKTIIVLPFENMSPDPDQEYFSDGLTEEIITDLSHIHDLLVVSRNSAMTFKGSGKTTKEIAEKVKVRYVLEGSVRKAGNNLRITAQLIDGMNDVHLWAEKYSGTLDDVFDIQEKVSRSIVDSLKLKLSPKEDMKISEHLIDNLPAYEVYLRATAVSMGNTEDAFYDAIRYFQRAIDLMGDNGLLYSGMAYTYFLLMNIGINIDENRAKVKEYAKKALTIDPEFAKVRAILAMLNIWYRGTEERNVKETVRDLKKIMASNPNESLALLGLIIVYFYAGKISVSVPLLEKYKQIEPFDVWSEWMPGYLYLYNEQYELALQEWHRLYESYPKQPSSQMSYTVALVYNNQIEEALDRIDQFVKSL